MDYFGGCCCCEGAEEGGAKSEEGHCWLFGGMNERDCSCQRESNLKHLQSSRGA